MVEIITGTTEVVSASMPIEYVLIALALATGLMLGSAIVLSNRKKNTN